MDGLRRRTVLRTVGGGVGVGLAGCSDSGYNALIAYCIPCSDSPGECDNDPIPSDEEPVAGSDTFQYLLDEASEHVDVTECEPESVQRSTYGGETWENVREVDEELPHGEIQHGDYVFRVGYSDERPEP